MLRRRLNFKGIIGYALLLVLVAGVASAIVLNNAPVDHTGGDEASLALARRAFPDAESTVPVSDDDSSIFWVLGPANESLGSIVLTAPQTDHIRGYAGPTPLLIAIDPTGAIESVVLLDNVETPSYVRRLLSSGFMDRWRGMSWRDAAVETGDVDAISMVTITADAIAKSLRHRLSLVDPESALAPPPAASIQITLTDVGLVLVVLLGVIVAMAPRRLPRWARLAQLSLSVVVLGVLSASMFSMALLSGWLRGGGVFGSVGLISLALAALALPILTRKNVYCHFVCPFGAVQELLFRMVPYRVKVPNRVHRYLRYVRYGLLMVVAASLLLGYAVDPNDLEPFSAFRPQAAGLAALLIAGISLLFAPVSNRPWCTYACGSGALLDTLKRPHFTSFETASISESAKPRG